MPNNPTPEQLREIDERVARLMGCKVVSYPDLDYGVIFTCHCKDGKHKSSNDDNEVRSYSTDLNAFMRDCVPWILEHGDRAEFVKALRRQVSGYRIFLEYEEINATALLRCLALFECVK